MKSPLEIIYDYLKVKFIFALEFVNFNLLNIFRMMYAAGVSALVFHIIFEAIGF